MAYAVLFPGQGSQFVGMGEELFAARPDLLADAADDVLGWSLREICLAGPVDQLVRTDRAQPALYALSYTLWEALRDTVTEPPAAAAGHSLGEYTALAAAGALDYATGLGLVAARGRAMAAAAGREPSGMVALLGVDPDGAEAIARKRRDDGGRLWVANLNAPGQVVLAGGADDLEWLAESGRALGARRVVVLEVAGAFHTPFMEPAAAELRAALAGVAFAMPAMPVWGNTDAAPMSGDVGDVLARQLTSPVRFAESLEGMASAGVDTFVHVGPGDVTAGMAKRAVRGARVLALSSLEDAAAVAAELAVPHTMARPEGEN